jgi:hypothetical protein
MEATSNICGTMGKDALSIRTAQHWFHRFKNGNFELDDLPHTGRPLEMDMDALKQLIEDDPRLTTRCLAVFRSLSNHLGKKNFDDENYPKWTTSTSLAKSQRTFTNAESFLYSSVGEKS